MELFTKQHQMNAPALNVLRAVVCKYQESGAISKNADFFLIQQKYNIQYSIFKNNIQKFQWSSIFAKNRKVKNWPQLAVEGPMKIMQIRAFSKRLYKKTKANP